jgi:parallel beta-helix repeat protein
VGILFLCAGNPVITHNRTDDNGEYGIALFISTGGKIVSNTASGSEEAGIYVGDSPNADVLIAGNESFDNELFGFFLRDPANGHVVGTRSPPEQQLPPRPSAPTTPPRRGACVE